MHNQCIHKQVLLLLIPMSGQIHNTISLIVQACIWYVHTCVPACLRVGVRVGGRAGGRASVRACVCVRECVRACESACVRE